MRHTSKFATALAFVLLLTACPWESIADEVVSGTTDLVNYERTQLPPDSPQLVKFESFQRRATGFRDSLKAASTPEGKIKLAPLLAELTRNFRIDFLPDLQQKRPLIAFVIDSGLRRLSEHFLNEAKKVQVPVSVAAEEDEATSSLNELRSYLQTPKVEKP